MKNPNIKSDPRFSPSYAESPFEIAISNFDMAIDQQGGFDGIKTALNAYYDNAMDTVAPQGIDAEKATQEAYEGLADAKFGVGFW